MNFKGIEICCPHCRGELQYGDQGADLLACMQCSHNFPVIRGIPDLRVFPDPYIGIEADRAKGIKVADQAEGLNFEQLVTYYYSITEVVTAKQAKQFTWGLLGAEEKAKSTLSVWHRETDDVAISPDQQRLLDVGCGTGPMLAVASTLYAQVVGVDIAFRWLVVAQKRLSEAGIDVPLFCACAEALPFADGSFDCVVADSSLEVVEDQAKTLSECRRVLRSGGNLFLSTANRYSIGPDPHAGIPAGGYLPDRWLAWYVDRQGGIPPKRKLLSAGSLSRLIREANFAGLRILLPHISFEQGSRFGPLMQGLVAVFRLVKRLRPGRRLLQIIGPQLLAVSRRP